MKKIKQFGLFLTIAAVILICMQSCRKDLLETKNETGLNLTLSDYSIYKGNQSELIPNSDFRLYELSTKLFTDYAEKQRLVKIPNGLSMTANGNGLLDFPDGTILVKTFFYYKDKRDHSGGKHIIETRVLIKSNSKWNAGTYLWNKEQTDANLIETGIDRTTNWIDESGTANTISYHVPSHNECVSCHNSNNGIIPIGTKARNMNMTILRNNIYQNQLSYFHNEGVLNAINPSLVDSMPDSKNQSVSIEKRARAYFDVNCAHCHNESGFASNVALRFDYAKTLQESMIKENKNMIINKLESGKMPKLGTTVIDKESVELIKQFLNTLN